MSKSIKNIVPEVEIEFLNGEKHKAKCSLGALVRFQRTTGIDLINQDQGKKITLSDVVMFITSCIYSKDLEVKSIEIEDNLSMQYALEKYDEIFKSITPKKEDTGLEDAEKK